MTRDESAIRDLIERWHSATHSGDIDTVLGLMTTDATFLTPGRPVMEGRDAFGKQLRELLRTHRIESTGDVREIAVADDLAYCWTFITVRVTPVSGGDANVRTGNTLSIFRKQRNGAWMLSRDANLL